MPFSDKEKRIYRKVSLDRLSSPDQLDQRLTVLPPMGWIAALSLLLLIGVGLTWAFWGSVSSTVTGRGVLTYPGGIYDMLSQTEGRITDIGVQVGDHVEKGQTLARVIPDNLMAQLEQYQAQIENLDAVTMEVLAYAPQSVDTQQYPEFESLSQQVQAMRQQYYARIRDDYAALGGAESPLQNTQLEGLRRRIQQVEGLIGSYGVLPQSADTPIRVIEKGIYYYDGLGILYRRQYAAPYQQVVYDFRGVPYVLLFEEGPNLPILYVDAQGQEIYSPDGDYYLPDYTTSLTGQPSVSGEEAGGWNQSMSVYVDQAGIRYIDLTDTEFTTIDAEVDNHAREQLLVLTDDELRSYSPAQLHQYLQELIQAELQIYQADSRMTASLQSAYSQAASQRQTLSAQLADIRNSYRQSLEAQQNTLRDQLAQQGTISATSTGTVVDIQLRKNDYAQIGTTFATMVGDRGTVENDTVILFVPADQGKQIKKGMEAAVSPSTAKKEKYGYIYAHVTHVAEYAATSQRVEELLKNPQLAAQLAGGTAVMEVQVQLQQDASTPSGYRWSSSNGYPDSIQPGTICSAEIKTATQRPVDLVLPFLRNIFADSGQ